jgi:hypothetical protein
MKHAGQHTLAALAPLLARLRNIDGLVERGTGIFYLRSKAFLHFHEDPAGVFADVRFDGAEFSRVALTPAAHADFVRAVEAAVAGLTAERKGRAVRAIVRGSGEAPR